MATSKTTKRTATKAAGAAPAVADHSHDELLEKIAALESRCAELEKQCKASQAACAKAESECKSLAAKCEAACSSGPSAGGEAHDPRVDELQKKLRQAFRHLRGARVDMPKF